MALYAQRIALHTIQLSLAGAATSIIFVTTNTFLSRQTRVCHNKHIFCHNKSMLVTTKLLLPQNDVCRDKYLSWQKFLTKDVFCHDNHVCLSQQNFCEDKIMFVATKVLSRQKYFVATNIILILVAAIQLHFFQPVSTVEQISSEYSHWRSWHSWAPPSHAASSSSLARRTPSAGIPGSWRWRPETTATLGTGCSCCGMASGCDRTVKPGAARAWRRSLPAESRGLAGEPCAKMSCWSGRRGGSLSCSTTCACRGRPARACHGRRFSGTRHDCWRGRGCPWCPNTGDVLTAPTTRQNIPWSSPAGTLSPDSRSAAPQPPCHSRCSLCLGESPGAGRGNGTASSWWWKTRQECSTFWELRRGFCTQPHTGVCAWGRPARPPCPASSSCWPAQTRWSSGGQRKTCPGARGSWWQRLTQGSSASSWRCHCRWHAPPGDCSHGQRGGSQCPWWGRATLGTDVSPPGAPRTGCSGSRTYGTLYPGSRWHTSCIWWKPGCAGGGSSVARMSAVQSHSSICLWWHHQC